MNLTPKQIVAELDKFIVGQSDAKKSVAIALRNRWRRMNAPEDIRSEIMPNNIIMIGPTGVGKTEIARRLAKLAGAPFIKVEATKFTEVGYVGRDVDSMIRDLTNFGVNLVQEEHKEKVRPRAENLAEEAILDILIPPINDGSSDAEINQRTREKFRVKLQNGDLNQREIEVEVNASNSSFMQVFTPAGMEEMGMDLQDMLGGMNRKKRKKRRMTVEEARKVLADEEAEKLLDMDAVNREAIERVEQTGIVFIDEIDKVAAKRSTSGADVSREGVQRDLLPIVEGSNVNTKHGLVKTDHILFIASGAFHVAKPSDLIPELQGRFPIRVELKSLSEEDFYRILSVPENALMKQYQAMFKSEGVQLRFTDDAIREIAAIAAQVNAEVENIGARRLHTILSTLLEDLSFQIPDEMPDAEIVIDKVEVQNCLGGIVKNRDLSQYIL